MLSPQLLNGVYPSGLTLIAVLAGASALTASLTQPAAYRPPPYLWLALPLAWLWTLLFVLPLPAAWVRWLKPPAAEAALRAAELLGDPAPQWIPLSLSPAQTWAEVVKGAAILSVFFAVTRLTQAVRNTRYRTFIAEALAASSLLMAAVALAHLALGLERVFAVYEPPAQPVLLAPILNGNQLAALFALGTPIMLGLALSSGLRGRGALWLAGAVATTACVVLAGSKGGLVGLVVGLGLFAALSLRLRRLPLFHPLTGLLAVAVVGGLALGVYAGADALMAELGQDKLAKIQLAAKGLELARQHPLLGVGRGAFSVAFVPLAGVSERFEYPENILVQWTAEWGFVVGLALVVSVVAAVIRAGRTRSFSDAGLAAALVGLAAHELFDFTLERLGMAVVGAALLGIVATPPRSADPPDHIPNAGAAGRVRRHRWALAATGAATILTALLLAPFLARAYPAFHVQRLEAHIAQPSAFRAELARAVRTHPHEPAFYLLAGAEAARREDAQSLAWLNRSMELAPGWQAPHAVAARVLLRSGRISQALVEIRACAERRGLGWQLACQVLKARPDALDALVRSARKDATGTALLDQVAACLPLSSEVRIELDRRLTRRRVPSAFLRAAAWRLAQDDAAGALAELARMAARPRRPAAEARATILKARALLALGRAQDALHELGRVERRGPAWTESAVEEGLEMRARAAAAADERAILQQTLAHLRGRARGRAARIAAAWVLEGDLEAAGAHTAAALKAYERAHRLDPTSGGLARIADLSERTGNLVRSHRAFTRLCRTHGPTSPYCTARDRVRKQRAEPPALPAQRRTQP